MHRSKKFAAATVAGALLVGGAIGVSGTAGAQGNVRAAVASEKGHQTVSEILQGLVDDGTITQEQADAIVARIEAARGDRGKDGPRGANLLAPSLEVASDVLGLSVGEIRTELRGGKTLAEIAADQDVSVEDLTDTLVAAANAAIDQAEADGELTAEEAEAKRAEVPDRVAELINKTFDGPGFGRGKGHAFGKQKGR